MADEPRAGSATGSTPPWQQDDGGEESLGSWLKKHRQGRDIQLQQIAEHTKINVSILEAIEEERSQDLPAPVFVRGYLRQYAHFVGLDAEQVVSHYAGSHAGYEREPLPTGGVDRNDHGEWVWIATGILLVAVAAGYWFYGRSAGPEEPSAATPSAVDDPAEGNDRQRGPQAGAVTTAAADDPRTDPAQGADPGDEASATPVTAAAPATTADAPGGEAVTTPVRVTIDFVEDCWVESTVDGVRQISTLYAKGESLRLEAEEQMRVFLGNYAGAVVQVNGQPYEWPPGNPGDATRELNIDAAFVAALTGEGRPDSTVDPATTAAGQAEPTSGGARAPGPLAGEPRDAQTTVA